ncbi:eukaryotic peptide chain release factor subunit 1 [Anaeramoeba ignava]|uniref:Eukaryotic peptide chain release factor subunit 1 n=1 Tax=Anaeramoeba ignava TaxID=1746090 RepID=A0A9Q0R819_ANAIG|nr:eukaryotic peptide chain release factor subunit 1 [Anaeramoeba ignava]
MLSEEDKLKIQNFRLKKFLREIQISRGEGTSLISMIIPANSQIHQFTTKLKEEMSSAKRIKSRVNRQSVIAALNTAVAKLSLYSQVPENGLALFAGIITNQDGKEKKICYDIEPPKPILRPLYRCDNRFHAEILENLIQPSEKYGFIVVDGKGCLFGVLCGNHKTIIHRFSVYLPKKHGRGGQSAPRFSRIRKEKRQHYLTMVSELATHHFITNEKPNIYKLVIAGSADLKKELANSSLFHPKLSDIILQIVSVSYGGDNGFNEAINLVAESLTGVRYVEESKILQRFFDEINQNTGKFCYGSQSTFNALTNGAVETLIVWENLDLILIEQEDIETKSTSFSFISPSIKSSKNGKENQMENEVQDEKEKNQGNVEENSVVKKKEKLFVDWIAENFHKFGTKLEFVSNNSQEGSQFCHGFGGIGGILRYQVKTDFLDMSDDDDDVVDDELYQKDSVENAFEIGLDDDDSDYDYDPFF